MIIGIELCRKKNFCSKLNAIFEVLKEISAASFGLGHLYIPLSCSPENFKKI